MGHDTTETPSPAAHKGWPKLSVGQPGRIWKKQTRQNTTDCTRGGTEHTCVLLQQHICLLPLAHLCIVHLFLPFLSGVMMICSPQNADAPVAAVSEEFSTQLAGSAGKTAQHRRVCPATGEGGGAPPQGSGGSECVTQLLVPGWSMPCMRPDPGCCFDHTSTIREC